MTQNDAVIKIGADVSGAMAGINSIESRMPGLSAAIASGFSIAGLVSFINSAIDAGDELNDLATKTGIAVETLAGFKLVASQNGTTIETLARGVKNLSVFMTEHGDKLRKAGIDARTADGALLQLSDVFANMADPVQRSALATELFGKAGVDLIPTLAQGSRALGEMIEKGKALNPITTEMAKQADAFNDQLAELKLSAAGVGTSLAEALLPSLNAVISRLNEGIQAAGGFAGGINALAYGAMSDDALKARIADYEAGNERGTLQHQYDQMVREGQRRGIVAGELKATTFSDAGFEAKQKSVAAAADSLTKKGGTPKAKAAKEPSGFQMSADESALLDQWSSDVIRQDMADAVAAAQERIDAVSSISRVARDMRLAQIDADLLTEKEREQLQFAERMAFLASAQASEAAQYADNLEAKAAIDEQYKARREELELQHQAKLGDISAQAVLQRRQFEQMTLAAQTSAVAGMLTAHLGAVANKNRAFFYAHKLGSIAQATISTYEGANKALAMGPIIGPPLAAMIVAAGLANVAQIKAQNFSGGGAGGSLPAYTSGQVGQDFIGSRIAEPPMPVTQAKAEAPKKQVHVTLVGDGFTYKDVAEKLIPLINEAVGNGIDITVGRG